MNRKERQEVFKNAKVVRQVPRRSPPREKMLEELQGATIINIGSFKDPDLAESGCALVIDYLANGKTKRIVFEFDEMGFWFDDVIEMGEPVRKGD